MKIIFLLLFCTSLFSACSQEDTATKPRPQVNDHELTIGQKKITVRQTRFETELPFLLVHLHGDEATALEATARLSVEWGARFIQLQNGQRRLVSFVYEGKTFQFDPNRIFSAEGIRKTLQLSGPFTESAFRELSRFSDSLLMLLNQQKPVVSVHNNTEGRFTILQYRDAGHGLVYINTALDPDDFFITNNEELFHLLKAENFNIVLEDAARVEEDGSLSLYSTRQGLRYINVEAQHGHLEEQVKMLEAVKRVLK